MGGTYRGSAADVSGNKGEAATVQEIEGDEMNPMYDILIADFAIFIAGCFVGYIIAGGQKNERPTRKR